MYRHPNLLYHLYLSEETALDLVSLELISKLYPKI